jgi:hypothetical protein
LFLIITENWLIKVISVVVALSFYAFHSLSLVQDRPFYVPLAVEGGSDLVPARKYTGTVRIHLRGSASAITPVLETDIAAFIDIGAIKSPGTYSLPVQLRRSNTAFTNDTLDISVDPIEVSITLDKRDSKFVNVSPILRGQVQDGYELSSWQVNPARIRIDGPLGTVRHIEQLSTERIDIEGRSGDFTEVTHLPQQDALITIHGDTVIEFRAVVRPKLIAKTFDALPILLTGLPARFSAEFAPAFARVRMEGPQDKINSLRLPRNFITLDASHIEEAGAYRLSPVIAAEDGFRLLPADGNAVADADADGSANAELLIYSPLESAEIEVIVTEN